MGRRGGDIILDVAGAGLVATAEGALVWPQESLLVVADLHLEKGSSLARRRIFLPPYDTAATLGRLARLLRRFAPRTLIFLGDTFHDRQAAGRILASDRDALLELIRRRDAVFIAGNHDPDPPERFGGRSIACVAIGPLIFRHEPSPGEAEGEIAGHLHPVARIAARGRSLRRRCFAGDGRRVVLPAFGVYAGGLNVRSEVFASLFPRGFTAHLMGEERVFAFPRARCLGD
jgi:DNA ligase-associated metallophosphoesterase